MYQREQLASKILQIGKAIAREQSAAGQQSAKAAQDGKRAHDAIIWIQKAFALVEKTGDEETPDIRGLKASRPPHNRWDETHSTMNNRGLFCVV